MMYDVCFDYSEFEFINEALDKKGVSIIPLLLCLD